MRVLCALYYINLRFVLQPAKHFRHEQAGVSVLAKTHTRGGEKKKKKDGSDEQRILTGWSDCRIKKEALSRT